MSAAPLFTYRADGKPLADALAAFAAALKAPVGDEAIPSLVYAAGWCRFAHAADARLLDPDVYEVRAFTAAAELRWLKDARTGGPLAAVVVSDTALSLDGWVLAERVVIDRIATTYLLWGKSAGVRDGWTTLATARVGALPVPVAGVPENGRVVLRAVEYVAADEFGAAHVFDERLTGLGEAAHA